MTSYIEKLARRMAENWAKVVSANSTSWKENKTKALIASYDTSDLWDIKWVGEETMRILFEHWIYSIEQLKKSNIDKIKLPIFGKNGINKFLNKK